MSRREDDLDLLHRAIAMESLKPSAREAFEGMLEMMTLDDSTERRYQLTDRQRAWVESVLGEAGEYKNLVSSGQVPNKCTVPTAPVLLNLPKKPPGRTT